MSGVDSAFQTVSAGQLKLSNDTPAGCGLNLYISRTCHPAAGIVRRIKRNRTIDRGREALQFSPSRRSLDRRQCRDIPETAAFFTRSVNRRQSERQSSRPVC